MDLVQHLMERLRPIVGLKGWDYCLLWKLSEDGRFVEWVDCCCGGIITTHDDQKLVQQNGSGDDDQQLVSCLVSNSAPIQCRDAMFQHPRTKCCDLLAQLPSSMPLDSGIHAQTMISNQARWLHLSDCSHNSQENVGTRVLIPVPVGLVELFVTKQVPEDQSTIDFVASQFNLSSPEQQSINANSKADSNFLMNEIQSNLLISQVNDPNDHFQLPPVSPATMLENLNISSGSNISENRMSCRSNSSMNFIQQFNYTENGNEPNAMYTFKTAVDNGFDQEMDAIQRQVMSENSNMNFMETKKRKETDKDIAINRLDLLSDCSDQNDEEIEPKYRRKNGKPPSKNLRAERKRRKKLNDRLYALRALVPKISKLDRASILGDAIEYVMELKTQEENLQNELQVEHSDDEGDTNNHSTIIQQEVRHGNGGVNIVPKCAHAMFSNVDASTYNGGIDVSKQHQDLESTNDKGQQMEPQVEVGQLEGNEFFVKVFCEHKPGGFVKLMEAFNSLGLEVTNVNVTSFRCLVMNTFKVEKRGIEMVQADHVRESLLELTRNPSRLWPDITPKAAHENDSSMDQHHHYHHSHLHNRQQSQLRHLHHLHN